MSKSFVRALVCGLLLVLSGCGSGLVFNGSPEMSPQEMLDRATLVFIGVIEKHQFDLSFLRVNIKGESPETSKYWKVLRRRVRVETVLRGAETRNVIDVYEIFGTGGASGDWNSTQDGERALLLVREENGRYHVVRDWWRSIFPVTSGPQRRLPLDDTHPLWERIALMNWWILRTDESAGITFPYFDYNDPGRAVSLWRKVKLERGLVRHPSSGVRVPACRALLMLSSLGQDECWETLSDSDKAHLSDSGYRCCTAGEVAATRRKTDERDASWWWTRYNDLDFRRLFTAINNTRLRREFCRLWGDQYPDDHDNGCPPDQPPPATIVTEQGDVPLVGPWPS